MGAFGSACGDAGHRCSQSRRPGPLVRFHGIRPFPVVRVSGGGSATPLENLARVGPTTPKHPPALPLASVGWIGSHDVAPRSLLNDCHPRPVNAYLAPGEAID